MAGFWFRGWRFTRAHWRPGHNLSMRIGILANSIPAALRTYSEVKTVPNAQAFVLLAPAEDDLDKLPKHLARFVAKAGRRQTLELIGKRAIIRLRQPLDHAETISRLRALKFDLGLHRSGNIYRRETIECFRLGILNAHIGLLPKYRGRSVMEWSLVQGDPVGISVFFVDEGIDTGERIVFSETVDVSHCPTIDQAKQFLFDQDARVYRRAVEQLGQGELNFLKNDASGRRYYVMSKLFQSVAGNCLATQSAISNSRSEI